MGRAVFTGRVTIAGHCASQDRPLDDRAGPHHHRPVRPGSRSLASSQKLRFAFVARTWCSSCPWESWDWRRRTTSTIWQLSAPASPRPSCCNMLRRCGCCLYMVARKLQRPTAQRVLGVALAVVGCALAVGLFAGRAGFPWLGSLRSSLQHGRSSGGRAGGHLLRVLQRIRTTPAPDLFPMDGPRVRAFLVGGISGSS